MQKEPALIVSAITAFLTAVIMLAVAFGVDFSEEQRNAILGMVAPTVGIVVVIGGLIRQFVYSPNSVEKIQAEAYVAGTPPTEPKPDLPPPADKDGAPAPAFEDHPDQPFIKRL